MQEVLYETIQDIVQALRAVIGELHARHPEATADASGAACREESCVALGRLEAQADSLRRSLGIASFRPRDF